MSLSEEERKTWGKIVDILEDAVRKYNPIIDRFAKTIGVKRLLHGKARAEFAAELAETYTLAEIQSVIHCILKRCQPIDEEELQEIFKEVIQ